MEFITRQLKGVLLWHSEKVVGTVGVIHDRSKVQDTTSNVLNDTIYLKGSNIPAKLSPSVGPKKALKLFKKMLDEAIRGVPRIKNGYNPATWVLEVTSSSVENQHNVDYAQIYANSTCYQDNQELIRELSMPPSGS